MNSAKVLCIVGVGLLFFCALTSEHVRGDEYRQRREQIQARPAASRQVPAIPAKEKRIRCIIDTDAKNEIDDVWAISGFYDLGDIAALADPDLASWEIAKCPEVDWDLSYHFKDTKDPILRCKDIDRGGTFALLRERLKQFENKEKRSP